MYYIKIDRMRFRPVFCRMEEGEQGRHARLGEPREGWNTGVPALETHPCFLGPARYVLGSLQLDLTKHFLRRIATEADVIGLPFFQVTRLCDGHSSVRKNLTIC
jgi:hypothetical protein